MGLPSPFRDDADTIDDIYERIRRLNGYPSSKYVNLLSYLDAYDPVTETGWQGVDFGAGPVFGAHLTGDRCFLVGGLYFLDFNGPGWSGSPLATNLPDDLWPTSLVNVTIPVDWENSSQLAGATVQADITTGGYINFEPLPPGGNLHFYNHSITAEDADGPTGGVQSRKWHQNTAGGSWFAPMPMGVPHDTYLIVDGISWMVEGATAE